VPPDFSWAASMRRARNSSSAALSGGIFHQPRTALLHGFAQVAGIHGRASAFFEAGVFPRSLRELQVSRGGVYQPDVAGLGVEHVANFAGDDGEQVVQLESGIEDAAEVVEGGEALERGELSLALGIGGVEVGERLASQAARFFQEGGVLLGKLAGFLVENLDCAAYAFGRRAR
jgi:hypothetical protein